jgi:hypothetical protein
MYWQNTFSFLIKFIINQYLLKRENFIKILRDTNLNEEREF